MRREIELSDMVKRNAGKVGTMGRDLPINQMTRILEQLGEQAEDGGFPFLRYLIGMAEAEAQEISRKMSVDLRPQATILAFPSKARRRRSAT